MANDIFEQRLEEINKQLDYLQATQKNLLEEKQKVELFLGKAPTQGVTNQESHKFIYKNEFSNNEKSVRSQPVKDTSELKTITEQISSMGAPESNFDFSKKKDIIRPHKPEDIIGIQNQYLKEDKIEFVIPNIPGQDPRMLPRIHLPKPDMTEVPRPPQFKLPEREPEKADSTTYASFQESNFDAFRRKYLPWAIIIVLLGIIYYLFKA